MPAGLGQRDGLRDELVEIDGQALILGLIGPVKFAQPMDDLGRVLGGGEDGGDGQQGVLFGQAMLGVAEQQLAKTHDDAERVVKVVGDAAGHGAERGEALLLDDLFLRMLEFRQRPLQLDGALADAVLERRVLRLNGEMRKARGEQVPNAQQDFDLVKGLRQEIGRAGGQRALPGRGGDVRGKHDDGQVVVGGGEGAQLPDDGAAIDSGHEPVGEDEVGLEGGEKRGGFARVGGADEVRESGAREDAFEQPDVGLFIVDDEDFTGLHGFGRGGVGFHERAYAAMILLRMA